MQFLWKSQLKRERGKFLPQSSEKKKKKREVFSVSTEERLAFLGGIFLWSLFLGTAVYVVIFSSYLKYGDWQVEGLSSVEEDSVRKTVRQKMDTPYLGFIPGDTFFTLQPRGLEFLLRDRYPLFRAVSVKRVFPHTLTVTVEERPVLVVWCSTGVCAHVLENGDTIPVTDAYQQQENKSRTVSLEDTSGQPIRFGNETFEQNFVAKILLLRDQLKNRFSLEIEDSLSFSSRFANEVRFRTKEGWEIYFSTLVAEETSLNAFSLLYDDEIPKERLRELEYIDLRTENRVFYRYRNSEKEEEKSEMPSEASITQPSKKEESQKKK